MFTFGFYNSYNGDRRYDAIQISSIFDGIIADGVFSNVGEMFSVVPGTGMQVIVKTGRAWFNHTWNLNDSWMSLDIDPSDALRSRIDSVVLEVNSDSLVRENTIKIVKGELAASPVPPTMIHTEEINQYRLANITIGPAVTNIISTNISIKVGTSETPFVTAPLKTMDITDIFQQWDGEFHEWFSHIKEELTGDVVTNLQKQIDERVKIDDKATTDDINNGTENKWIDAKLYQAIRFYPENFQYIQLTTSGTWVAPNNIKDNKIHVMAFGGGGGGGAYPPAVASSSFYYGAGGGGGGGHMSEKDIIITPGASYTYTIGAGGNGARREEETAGNTGGKTIFGNSLVVADGGGGGGSGRSGSAPTFSSGGVGGNGGTGGGCGGNTYTGTYIAGTGTYGGNGGSGRNGDFGKYAAGGFSYFLADGGRAGGGGGGYYGKGGDAAGSASSYYGPAGGGGGGYMGSGGNGAEHMGNGAPNGCNATGFAGGGGGGGVVGGNGAPGIIIITYYITAG